MPYWQPANNDVPSVADLVAYIADQVISQVTSGTRPTGTIMQLIGETDTGRFQGHTGSGWVGFGGLTSAAFTSHTPTLDQGATTNIAKTVNYSKWVRLGNFAVWFYSLSITGAGTAGSNATLTLPVTADGTSMGIGVHRILDSSTTTSYHGLIIPSGTTAARFFVDTAAGTAAWGTHPNLALASGDGMNGLAVIPIA